MCSLPLFILLLIEDLLMLKGFALELLTVLLENPTDDSVEVAVGFVTECDSILQDLSPKGLHDEQLNDCNVIEASFVSNSTRRLHVEKCGLRLLFQHDEDEFSYLTCFQPLISFCCKIRFSGQPTFSYKIKHV
ncbi:pre-mRNA-splicing factor cwc22-like [Humulus lupulus]|uniref:pre-mRNA-splicing factor cwc22-like n=1 Tax=Humulus lupulus TaxID=3486 RepID=UPI002B40E5D3|nr:pre-mRNA-splicing factor cwc22-like [Humulus lupulus]